LHKEFFESDETSEALRERNDLGAEVNA